jgi:hypothetical protein
MNERKWENGAPPDEKWNVQKEDNEVIFKHATFDEEEGVHTTIRKILKPENGKWEMRRQDFTADDSLGRTIQLKTRPDVFREFKSGVFYEDRFTEISNTVSIKRDNFRQSVHYSKRGDKRELSLEIFPNSGLIAEAHTVYVDDTLERFLKFDFDEDDASLILKVSPHARIPQTNFLFERKSDSVLIKRGAEKLGVPFHLSPEVVGYVEYTPKGFIDTRIQREGADGEVLLGSQIRIPMNINLEEYWATASSNNFEWWRTAAQYVTVAAHSYGSRNR